MIASQLNHQPMQMGSPDETGFRAVAAALLDQVLSHSSIDANWMTKVLDNHVVYFPNYRVVIEGLSTSLQRFRQLMKQISLYELLQTLAFTLRQMAVDELCAHPEWYRGVFQKKKPPFEMRQAEVILENCALGALATALGLPLQLEQIEFEKSFAVQRLYNPKAKGVRLQLQWYQGVYKPRIQNKASFLALKPHVIRIQPTIQNESDLPLDELLLFIEEDNERLMGEYQRMHHRLSAMVACGELKKTDLLALYVHAMKQSDKGGMQSQYVGTEQGNSQFFKEIKESFSGKVEPEVPRMDYEAQLTQALIEGLARGVSLGQMSKQEVFLWMETMEDIA